MSYLEVRRRAFAKRGMPNNIIRMHTNSIVIAPNIAERFQASRYETDGGRGGVKFGIAIDLENNLIKLIPGSINAFSFIEASNSNEGSPLYCQKPSEMKRIPVVTGDYLMIDDQNLEFQLAT